MTKHTKPELSKETLPLYLLNMNKDEMVVLISESFNKQQMITAIKNAFAEAVPLTYDNMHLFFKRKFKNE
jgi:hypothetical protein